MKKSISLFRNMSFLLLTLFLTSTLTAQTTTPPEDWYLLNPQEGDYYGINLRDTEDELLGQKKGNEIIVAILDSGVDIFHEDLDDNAWTNEDEIAENGKDDDDNGYVDDVHGWNFIGGGDGENVHKDNLEITRLLRKYRDRFAEVENPTTLSKKQKKEYAYYLTLKRDVEKNRQQALDKLNRYRSMKEQVLSSVEQVNNSLAEKEFSLKNIKALETENNQSLQRSKQIVMGILSQMPGEIDSAEQLSIRIENQLQRAIDHFDTKANYQYNPDFDPRPIVGDDYDDPDQRIYGNPDVEGPDAFHGTHVAGIVAAEQNNDLGMDGISSHARIMSVRTVPDGDERDKDVANAIRYAVDNGASVINMSFGKGYSWNKHIVDEAVKYAAKHDVLMIHAAGNGGVNNDSTDNFPNDEFKKSALFSPKFATNWIEVGAIAWKKGEGFVAPFSNYGAHQVDLFAPGMSMYSTVPDDEYQRSQGTSMAAPVVTGVAAMIRSYFPELEAGEVKDILMASASRETIEVKKPGSEQLVPFQTLSVSGGVVNAYNAFRLAMEQTGKYTDTLEEVDGDELEEDRTGP